MVFVTGCGVTIQQSAIFGKLSRVLFRDSFWHSIIESYGYFSTYGYGEEWGGG